MQALNNEITAGCLCLLFGDNENW